MLSKILDIYIPCFARSTFILSPELDKIRNILDKLVSPILTTLIKGHQSRTSLQKILSIPLEK